MGAVYQIIIVIVVVYSILRGFRKGFTGQLNCVLALGFGAVGANVLSPMGEDMVKDLLPIVMFSPYADFIYEVSATMLLYSVIYLIVYLLTWMIRFLMKGIYVGIVNQICGSLFMLMNNLMWVSVCYNLLLCVNPRGELLSFARSDDANMVHVVMLLSPALTGSMSVNDLWYMAQLEDAKKISCNFSGEENVIDNKRILSIYDVKGKRFASRNQRQRDT